MSKKLELPDSPADAARLLARQSLTAVLSTAERAPKPPRQGWPSSALVTIACDTDGSPILLLSDIAHHTQNVKSDARASLLIESTVGYQNPQEGPRVSLMGRIKVTRSPALAERFLARHPRARFYAGFADFNFYRMTIDRAHFVGGFARAHWLKGKDILSGKKAAAEIRDIEPGVLDHMNSDHREALTLYGQKLLGARGTHWTMTGIDPDGIDLRCGQTPHRLTFDNPLSGAAASRAVLVELATKARSQK
ncbi:MAG: DUF2470 domain-containing protein [Proteobacteria bacterium]|nr:DUF2470 domain-containing protein [Pseudomonadota bacterium]